MTKRIMGAAAAAMLCVGFSPLRAGMLDLRVGAGLSAANPDAFEQRVKDVSGSTLRAKTFDTYNADVVFRFPGVPVTLGVRFEQANQKRNDAASEWKLNVNNLALLVDWRLINSAVYVGPIVSVGYPWANLKFHDGANRVDRRIHSNQISYSGGLEAGVYLGPLLIGAEAGYKSIRFKGDASAGSSLNAHVDLDGVYGKALVGLTFL